MTLHSKCHRVYVDLEYCYPGMTRESGRPTDLNRRQVVQIAAILYDNCKGVELGTFNLVTFPKYTKKLPVFFTELTGITQVQLMNQAVDFPEALRRFTEFSKGIDVYTFDKDWEVLIQNCGYFNIDFPFKDHPFQQVKPLLTKWGLNADDYSSGTLYQAAGLRMEGHVHNALHDVRSMANAVYYFESS